MNVITSEDHMIAPFRTISGRTIDLLDPKPEDVDIEGIAHALSMTCRFAGNVTRFYSNAQHSVLVSHLMRGVEPVAEIWLPPPFAILHRLAKDEDNAEAQLAGLLHDGAEPYTGDMTGPMKDAITFVCSMVGMTANPVLKIERRIQNVIMEHVGIFDTGDHPRYFELSAADRLATLVEEHALGLTPEPPDLPGFRPVIQSINLACDPWTQEEAKERFLDLFASLDLKRRNTG